MRKSQIQILSFLWALFLLSNAQAAGSKPPTPPPNPPSQPPSSPIDDSPASYFEVGRKVDATRNRSELSKSRAPATHRTDSCVLSSSADTFIESIGSGVEESFVARAQELDYLATASWDPYDLYQARDKVDVSLSSHSMCRVTSESLKRNMSTSSKAAKLPNNLTIERMNSFVGRYNTLRTRLMSGDSEAGTDLKLLWAKLLGCLAYVESLGDADASSSESLAREFGPQNYTRPQGVNFYYDRGQPVESALNIGLFQFAPGSNGNIQGCIQKWNNVHGSCQISSRASRDEMIRILGSSRQAFNAFCGANQILNTFYVQANTTNSYRSDSSNNQRNGSLRSPRDRCVSLHMRTGRSYNHFGPFHNSTGSNLATLMSCVEAR